MNNLRNHESSPVKPHFTKYLHAYILVAIYKIEPKNPTVSFLKLISTEIMLPETVEAANYKKKTGYKKVDKHLCLTPSTHMYSFWPVVLTN